MLLFNHCQFLKSHLEAAITCHDPHQPIRTRHLGADRCWQCIAHRAQTAARQQLSNLIVNEVLAFPHLVLSDIGHDNRGLVARIVRRVPELPNDEGRDQFIDLIVNDI